MRPVGYIIPTSMCPAVGSYVSVGGMHPFYLKVNDLLAAEKVTAAGRSCHAYAFRTQETPHGHSQ